MLVSLVISVYKDVASLRAILDVLPNQTYQNFEIIVTEDGECQAMRDFFTAKPYKGRQAISHLTQEDIGWRKNKALNNAIAHARGEYLIIIDGDCVPHSRFIEGHVRVADRNSVVSGGRVMLGPTISEKVKKGAIPSGDIERTFYRRLFSLLRDGGSFLEEGIYINPDGLFGRFSGKRVRDILGCNFSCYKDAMLAINGFDEDYVYPRAGEDNDVRWRLEKNGVKLKSARNIAIQYHLDHGRSHYDAANNSMALLEEKQGRGETFCRNGLKKIR